MSQSNDITVKSYSEEYQTYINKTANEVVGSVKEFIDTFLSFIDKTDHILEIGSGTGRDADYIERLGYKILRTDAAHGFVKHMSEQRHDARVLNIVDETLNEKFDAIFANAVFLHFDDEDFIKATNNVQMMLKKNGIFAVSLHKGTFIGMSDHKHTARYFHEWTEEKIKPLVTQLGFQIVSISQGKSISKRKEWIMLVLRNM